MFGLKTSYFLNYNIIRYYFTRHTHKPRARSYSLSPTSHHSSPSTSYDHPFSSLLPVNPLPDIFTGVMAYLYGYEREEEQRRERERYLIAYDGDITNDIIDHNTTHIIVRAGVKVNTLVCNL